MNLFITYEEFQEMCRTIGPTSFRENGKNGWTSVDRILDKTFKSESGPHWVDASPIPATQRLRGMYNFNSGLAVFY